MNGTKFIIAFGMCSLGLLSISEPANARSVANFLSVAEPLRAKGIFGMYSPEFQTLNAEADAALAAWLKQTSTAKPKVCANKSAINLTVDEFLGLLRSVPVAKRTTLSVDNAVLTIMNKRYRCSTK